MHKEWKIERDQKRHDKQERREFETGSPRFVDWKREKHSPSVNPAISGKKGNANVRSY